MHHIEDVLLVQLFQLAVVVGGAQVVLPLVGQPGEVEVVALVALAAEGEVADAACGVQAQILEVAGVALVGFLQLAGVEDQAGDLLGVQVAAEEVLRQQARVVGRYARQLGHQAADLEHGLGDLGLEGGGRLGVFARALVAETARQQVAAGALVRRVEFQAQTGVGIQTEANGTLGIAGLGFEDKALCPLFALGLLRCRGVAQITIEIEITRFDAGLAVLDEFGVGDVAQGQAQGAGGYGQRQGGLSHYGFLQCFYGWHIGTGADFDHEGAGTNRIRWLTSREPRQVDDRQAQSGRSRKSDVSGDLGERQQRPGGDKTTGNQVQTGLTRTTREARRARDRREPHGKPRHFVGIIVFSLQSNW
ncbi:hypothetical protein D3C85_179790 [compost metagenome]